MAHPSAPDAESLFALAVALRDAAVRAQRPDVAAKAEEAIALLGPVADGREQPATDKANLVVRIMDGLGL